MRCPVAATPKGRVCRRAARHGTDAHGARADASRADVGAAMEWLKSVHFYRKVPRDLTEATLAGGTISLISSIVMAYLFISNFSAAALVGSSTCIARPARRGDGRGWPRLGAACAAAWRRGRALLRGSWLEPQRARACVAQAYLSVEQKTSIVLDASQEKKLQLNFNVTLYHLPCRFATLDIVDVMGTHFQNVTRAQNVNPNPNPGPNHESAAEESARPLLRRRA